MSGTDIGRHQTSQWRIAQQARPVCNRVSHYQSGSRKMRQRPATRHTLRQQKPQCRATAATDKLEAKPLQPDAFIQDRMDFLREDLQHLFDEQGVDRTAYEEMVAFRDPLSRYNTLSGYLFNIQFLRRIFGPKFILHDLRRTGDHEITSRWTMLMSLQPNKISPLRRWWDPELVFTGVSIMSLNPESGKFVSHIDYWDAVENQEFLSLEAVCHLVGQLTTLAQAPRALDTPDFLVLRRFADCDVRRYEPFTVAETATSDITSTSTSNGGSSGSGSAANGSNKSSGKSAFFRLADYIFGKANISGEKMAMTTPVFTSSAGAMQFVVGKGGESQHLPAPTDDSVTLKQQPGGHYACVTFSGVADEQQVQRQLQRLRQAAKQHNLKLKSPDDYIVARYNDPSTKPIFRRNEVLVELEDFELWYSKQGAQGL